MQNLPAFNDELSREEFDVIPFINVGGIHGDVNDAAISRFFGSAGGCFFIE